MSSLGLIGLLPALGLLIDQDTDSMQNRGVYLMDTPNLCRRGYPFFAQPMQCSARTRMVLMVRSSAVCSSVSSPPRGFLLGVCTVRRALWCACPVVAVRTVTVST